jgi:hypothetical protein
VGLPVGRAHDVGEGVLKPTATTTPFKMTAAAKISVTVATGPLTAGVIEVWVLYTTAAA